MKWLVLLSTAGTKCPQIQKTKLGLWAALKCIFSEPGRQRGVSKGRFQGAWRCPEARAGDGVAARAPWSTRGTRNTSVAEEVTHLSGAACRIHNSCVWGAGSCHFQLLLHSCIYTFQNVNTLHRSQSCLSNCTISLNSLLMWHNGLGVSLLSRTWVIRIRLDYNQPILILIFFFLLVLTNPAGPTEQAFQ